MATVGVQLFELALVRVSARVAYFPHDLCLVLGLMAPVRFSQFQAEVRISVGKG